MNDKVKVRLPIGVKLLEMLLFELERKFGGSSPQPYLEALYKNMFSLAYYGLMRVGELACGPHTMKARNIHTGKNKNKILIVLYTSKTHGIHVKPQEIKITALSNYEQTRKNRHFCPFQLTRKFLMMRGPFLEDDEPYFVTRNRDPIQPNTARTLLRELIGNLNLEGNLYDLPFNAHRQSFRNVL